MNTINFIYFAYNFNFSQLRQIFILLGNAEHFKSSWENSPGNDGTQKFLSWFLGLSRNNQMTVVEYVEKNYKGVSS